MKSITYKIIEFLIVFIFVPLSFTTDYAIWIKLSIGFIGFLYILYVLLYVEKEKVRLASDLNWRKFWKVTLIKLIVIAVITSLFVMLIEDQSLFTVVINKPKLWVIILFVYSVFSVYPQELIYRTFYFKRYNVLVHNKSLLILLNAVVFCVAHLFFGNMLVVIITFLGGLLFAKTYTDTQSTIMVSIEHAIYGCWLFTVGMGGMLGFPT